MCVRVSVVYSKMNYSFLKILCGGMGDKRETRGEREEREKREEREERERETTDNSTH